MSFQGRTGTDWMKMGVDKGHRGAGGGGYERDLPDQMCSLTNACGKSVSLLKRIISKYPLKKITLKYPLEKIP